jgi:hypothetical protein
MEWVVDGKECLIFKFIFIIICLENWFIGIFSLLPVLCMRSKNHINDSRSKQHKLSDISLRAGRLSFLLTKKHFLSYL